jgi:hypothetical protein
MNIASLHPVRALALISILAVGCGTDEEGITSLPPPAKDDAAVPMLPPDAAAPTPDPAATIDAGEDGPAGDAAADAQPDSAVDGATDVTADAEADARTCGGMGQAPCPGAQCAAGLCLSDMNRCIGPGTPCGQQSGNCNANGTCGVGGQACGGENEACCGIGEPPQGAFCTRPGTTCVGNGMNRTCRACGDKGQPCCGDPGTCLSGTCTGNGGNRVCQ